MNSSRITPDFSRGASVMCDSSGEPFWNEVPPGIYAMTLTIFIALCLLGCGFMQYVLIRWIRDEQLQAQTRRAECKVTSKENQSNQSQRANCYKQLVDLEHGTGRFESSLDCSERTAYERIARSLTPRKRA